MGAPRKTRLKYVYTLDDKTICANTAAEIIANRLNSDNPDEYLEADEDTQAATRRKVIVQHFGLIKSFLANEDQHPEFFETLDMMDAAESEVTAFCQTIKEPVIGLPDNTWRFDKSHVPDGRDPIPLYIIASDYEPFTEVPLPRGDEVYVLDWTDEVAFLESISNAGLGEFAVVNAMSRTEMWELIDALVAAAKGQMPPEIVAEYDSSANYGEWGIAIDSAIEDALDGLWTIPADLWPAIIRWTASGPYHELSSEFVHRVKQASQAAAEARDGYLTLAVDRDRIRAVNEFVCPLAEGMTLDAGDIVWFTDVDGRPFAARVIYLLYGEKEALFERVNKYGRPKPPSADPSPR